MIRGEDAWTWILHRAVNRSLECLPRCILGHVLTYYCDSKESGKDDRVDVLSQPWVTNLKDTTLSEIGERIHLLLRELYEDLILRNRDMCDMSARTPQHRMLVHRIAEVAGLGHASVFVKQVNVPVCTRHHHVLKCRTPEDEHANRECCTCCCLHCHTYNDREDCNFKRVQTRVRRTIVCHPTICTNGDKTAIRALYYHSITNNNTLTRGHK